MTIFSGEIDKISNEWRVLQNQWQNTREQWNDNMQQRFTQEFWREFESLTPAYLRKLRETSDLVANAYRALEL